MRSQPLIPLLPHSYPGFAGATPGSDGAGDGSPAAMDFDQADAHAPEFDQPEFDQPPPDFDHQFAAEGDVDETPRRPQVPWPADAETLQELGDADDEDLGAGGSAPGGFTGRTRLVMLQLQRAAMAADGSAGGGVSAAAGRPGSKRKRVAAPAPGDESDGSKHGGGVGVVQVSLASLTQGRSRLDACRWFYESLVLQNRGLAKLRQDEPYGDLAIAPNLRAMAAA
jgi:hypothetical protein